jgi:hypothetical protein
MLNVLYRVSYLLYGIIIGLSLALFHINYELIIYILLIAYAYELLSILKGKLSPGEIVFGVLAFASLFRAIWYKFIKFEIEHIELENDLRDELVEKSKMNINKYKEVFNDLSISVMSVCNAIMNKQPEQNC